MTTMRHEYIDLQAAIAKINAFNSKNLPTEDMPLTKTMGLMRAFFAKKGKTKTSEECSELLRAIEVLSDQLHLIENFQKGSPQQQKLAASALQSIEQFNAIIDFAKKNRSTLSTRIQEFLGGGSLLPHHLPPITRRAKAILLNPDAGTSQHKVDHVSLKMVSFAKQEIPHLSKQGIQLFVMKTIALTESYLTHTEAREAFEKSMVFCEIDPNPATCTASCHLDAYVVKIRFRKDHAHSSYTCMESFEINPKYSDTRDPSQ